MTLFNKRLLNALSWHCEIWKILIGVKDEADGKMLYVDMYMPPLADTRVSVFGVFTHILREVSASLPVQLQWAIPGPRSVERVASAASRFCFLSIAKEEALRL